MDYKHPGKTMTLVGDSGQTMSYVTQSVDTVGAYCENGLRAGAGTLRLNSLIPSDTRYFDVFSCSSIEKAWVAETSDDWIVLSQTSGATRTEQRVLVNADWDKVSELPRANYLYTTPMKTEIRSARRLQRLM